jgi:alpha/beta superfamily hydrolase
MQRIHRVRDVWSQSKLVLQAVLHEQLEGGEERVVLRTSDGDVECRYHPADGQSAVIWLGGAAGGFDGPADGLYLEMCRRFAGKGIAGLRLHYRHLNSLDECALDAMLAAEHLASSGFERIVVVGYSFGGAVAITAAALSDKIQGCVPLSTHLYGSGLAGHVSPKPMLLIHGDCDETLPHTCSQQVYARAMEPKELALIDGAGHDLREGREEVVDLLERWIPVAVRVEP